MKKLSRQPARFRRVTTAAVLALASVAMVACEETTGVGAVSGVEVVVIPIGTTTTNLMRGSTVQLLAAPHDANNQFVNTPVTWASSNNAIATVDANGLVTGVEGAAAGGTVNITATAAGQTGTFELNFQKPAATVTITPATAPTIRREGTVVLTATVLDGDGNPAGSRTVNWSSSATGTATVTASSVTNASGVATATVAGVADGTVTITASAENNEVADVTGTRDVNVSGAPLVATVTVTPGTGFRAVGQTLQLSHSAAAGSGTAIPGTTATWSSSNNTIATVSPTGLVTFLAPGTVSIRADVDNGEGTNIRGTATLESADILPNTVVVNVPTVAEGEFIDYAFVSNGTVANFSVETVGGATGDSDMHIFAPGVTPAFVASQLTYSNFVCRPWLVGSDETCNVASPVAGTYRIRFYNYPGEGALVGMTAELNHP